MNSTFTETFALMKAKPFCELLNISQARFNQKLRGHKIKGKIQQFSAAEIEQLRHGLTLAAIIIKQEAENL